ncbi:MAG: hypothetical protein KJ645_13150 [Planctomycetes bacterium]|nr:hypothetical protein [Planctomycetota bacterium]
MSATVKFKVDFAPEPVSTRPTVRSKPVPRVARMLALAHYIEQAVEDGTLDDYTHAARILELSRARLSQVLNLKLLAPSIQTQILTDKVQTWERVLRKALRTPIWKKQEELFNKTGVN